MCVFNDEKFDDDDDDDDWNEQNDDVFLICLHFFFRNTHTGDSVSRLDLDAYFDQLFSYLNHRYLLCPVIVY